MSGIDPYMTTGHPDAGRVYAAELEKAKATIAQQAQMIEHLRGGLIQGSPVAWRTEDHLTDKSATTYDSAMADRWRAKGWPVQPLYDTPSEQSAQYTVVDMANAARDGFRDGAASLMPILEMARSYVGFEGSDAELEQLEAAIIAAGGKVKE